MAYWRPFGMALAQSYIRPAEAVAQMRVIIAGAGEVGRGVAAALRQERRSVAIIDPDPTAINESQTLDCLLVTGSALSRESLLRAGISDAEILVLATNDDETNFWDALSRRRSTANRWVTGGPRA